MNLSDHLTLAEVSKSNTATRLSIPNQPKDGHLAALVNLAENVFEPLRNIMCCPIGISSGYRSMELNKAIGGSPSSQHSKGEALDLDADIYKGCTNQQLFEAIKLHLPFDQLIWEYGTDLNPDWVHVSLKYNGEQRSQVLRASKVGGRTVYTNIK